MHPLMASYISLTLLIKLLLPYLVAASSIICILLLQHHKKSKIKKKIPPGNMGLPFIGETMEFYRAQQNNRLFEDFITPRIEKHGNTFKTKLMGSPTVIVNGLEANRFFLANEFKLVVSSWPSSSVQLMGQESIMEKTGECHRSLRTILAPCLGGTGLEALVPKICKVVKAHLVKDWGNEKGVREITLYKSAKFLIFTIMCECVLEMEATEGLFDCFERVLEGVFSPPLDVPGTSFWRAKKARKEIERELSRVVRKKRKEMEVEVRSKDGFKSLLSRLVGALINGEITEVEVIDNMVLFIFAAHDTTSFAIAMTFKMLAQHSNCYTTLLQEHMKIKGNKSRGINEGLTMEDVKEMKYTWQVVRESMRLCPPVFGSFRRAIKEFEFDGFTIPQGWKVLWTVYGTHYSEEYFKEAHRFDPSRFEETETIPPYAFLAFGGGPRTCAGNQLAKLNILIFVHFVVTNYNWSLVEDDEPILMDPLPIPSKGMPITISPFISNHSPNR